MIVPSVLCVTAFVSLCRGCRDVLPQCEEGPGPVPAALLWLCQNLAAQHEERWEGPPPHHQLPQWLLQANLWTHPGVRLPTRGPQTGPLFNKTRIWSAVLTITAPTGFITWKRSVQAGSFWFSVCALSHHHHHTRMQHSHISQQPSAANTEHEA